MNTRKGTIKGVVFLTVNLLVVATCHIRVRAQAASAALGPGNSPMARGKSGQLKPVGGKSSGAHGLGADSEGAAAAAVAAAHQGEAIEKLKEELEKMRDDRDSAVQLRQVGKAASLIPHQA